MMDTLESHSKTLQIQIDNIISNHLLVPGLIGESEKYKNIPQYIKESLMLLNDDINKLDSKF